MRVGLSVGSLGCPPDCISIIINKFRALLCLGDVNEPLFKMFLVATALQSKLKNR